MLVSILPVFNRSSPCRCWYKIKIFRLNFFIILIKFYVRLIQYYVKGFLGRGLDLLLFLAQSVSLPVTYIFCGNQICLKIFNLNDFYLLNERKENYRTSLNRLQNKAKNRNFLSIWLTTLLYWCPIGKLDCTHQILFIKRIAVSGLFPQSASSNKKGKSFK